VRRARAASTREPCRDSTRSPDRTHLTPEEKLRRADRSKAVLNNPAYQEAVTQITQDIRSLRLSLSPRDTEGAYRLVLMEQAVERAKRLMEQYMADGETARKELEREELPGPVGRLNRRFQRLIR
jgi:hypothetical protein